VDKDVKKSEVALTLSGVQGSASRWRRRGTSKPASRDAEHAACTCGGGRRVVVVMERSHLTRGWERREVGSERPAAMLSKPPAPAGR
jgi:hypothetical protein